MTVYEKARELGELMLESKEGKRLYDAKFVFEGDDDAKRLFAEYTRLDSITRAKMKEGNMSQDELAAEIDKLNKMGEKVLENSAAAELMKAREEFNGLVNTVLEILRETVLKDEGNSGCSGSCSSCGGCH